MFKKVVFTGGACGGKSSIIKALKTKLITLYLQNRLGLFLVYNRS